jgi:hypothetical protein
MPDSRWLGRCRGPLHSAPGAAAGGTRGGPRRQVAAPCHTAAARPMIATSRCTSPSVPPAASPRFAGPASSLRCARPSLLPRSVPSGCCTGALQGDHIHLLVEAECGVSLVRGCQGLAARVAKAVNRVLSRHGAVWGDRYHARRLGTPSEVRRALVYVLQNWKKHVPGARGLDPRSSAAWFEGWQTLPPRGLGAAPVRVAQTWLARVGWRRYGRLDFEEGPRRTR